jgi:hypothetical protein
MESPRTVLNGSYYRKLNAVQEGRPSGRNGRPPLIEPEALPLLFCRVRQKILMKEQVTCALLLNLVFFLSTS